MYNFKFIEKGLGEIQIDDFKELFESDHSFWNNEQYEEHWEISKAKVKNGEAAFFFTSITDPKHANFFRTWVCYPIKNELIFQEQLLFLNELAEQFDINNPHKHISPYVNITEDGDEISEWRTKRK